MFRPRVGVALGLALIADVAHAHAASAQAGAFYAGLLHPLTAPEHVLPMLALGLLAGQQGLNQGQGVLLAFPAALGLGASLAWLHPILEWMPLLNLTNLASAVLFGGLVASALRLPTALLYALAALFGISHGYANGAAIAPSLSPAVFILGLVTAALLVLGYSLGGMAYLLRLQPAWIPIAVRVAGSWITAIGILTLSMGGKTLIAG
jgi:urease accessory protein